MRIGPDMDLTRRILVFSMAFILCLAWISSSVEPPDTGADAMVAEVQDESYEFYAVFLGDLVIGVTDDPEAVESALSDALEFRRIMTGFEVSLDEPLSFEARSSSHDPAMTPTGKIRANIEEMGTFLTHAIAVKVSGDVVGIVRDSAEAENIIREIKDLHREQRESEGGVRVVDVKILEEVQFVPHPVDPEDIINAASLEQILVRGTDKVVEHEVRSGDTAWGIAETAGMSVNDLERANPGSANLDRLSPGDRINLVVADPHITLRTEETHTYKKYLPFDVQTKSDPDMWPWERVVEQAGQRGEVEVTAKVVYEAGSEVEREVLSEEHQSDPVTHVVVQGTKTVPQRGSGQFIVPAKGTLSSGFGPRSGGFHTGIDLAMPIGTAVRAADSGTVTTAGWQGAYGRTIIVDHGGGEIVTVYAHLNSTSVSVGDVVSRGDVIGYSGNTGRSTGPHLHFEVRVGGSPRNPINYFPN